jgi:hypothetical protein
VLLQIPPLPNDVSMQSIVPYLVYLSMHRLLLLTVFTFYCSIASAINKDTLRPDEMPALEAAYKQSAFSHFQLMNAHSEMKDSTAAGEALLKIDPYFMIWSGHESPGPILHKMAIRNEVLATYRQRYDSVYNLDRSELYQQFRRMADKDAQLRNRYMQCADTYTCRSLYNKIKAADSTNAIFLYNYINAHGWPKAEDGGYYAATLVLHDTANRNMYMPHFKKAVLNGVADLYSLKLMNNIINRNLDPEYDRIALAEKNNSHIRFSVSELLTGRNPGCLPRIQKTISAACGKRKFKYCFIFEAPDMSIYERWAEQQKKLLAKNHPISKMVATFQPYCKEVFPDEHISWTVMFRYAETTQMFLLFVYE